MGQQQNRRIQNGKVLPQSPPKTNHRELREKNLIKGTSKNWHMARDRRLWRADKEQTPGAAPLRAVTGFATMAESIRICLPSGCESFWLKEECSSLGVST